MRLRVLHIVSGDLWAGAEVLACNLLRELDSSGAASVLALVLNEGTLAEKLRQAEVETIVLSESRYPFPSLAFNAVQLLAGQHVHVVHSHRYKENLLAATIAPFLGHPRLVTTVHGIVEITGPPSLRQRVLNSLNCLTLKRRFSRVVAVSQQIARHLTIGAGFPRDQVCVIHNGIVLPRTPGPESPIAPTAGTKAGPHIGSVGRLVPVKDFSLFLDTAALLRKTIPRAQFSILGDGPLREALARQSRELGLSDCLQLLRTHDDPSHYYRSLDLYLNTSHHEGIPMSVLEAMSHGIPVIAPRVGGLPEILLNGQEDNLITGRDPEAFARRCSRILSDPVLWQRCSHQVTIIARERFSIQRTAAAYGSLYSNLLGSGISGRAL